ncbi:hypothetical protein [Shewanella algae]|nr:hypothetical protein [Shewanella algae]
MKITTIGLDIAKLVFHAVAVNNNTNIGQPNLFDVSRSLKYRTAKSF